MLQAPAAPSNWPHAIDSLYDNGKRRRKQYFPDGLPGMFMLSKTEVADDIDLIEADADRTGYGHARRRACRSDAKEEADMDLDAGDLASGVQNSNSAQNKVSKRRRLLDRILDEHGIREDARVELTKARRALDDIGEQILTIRDETARVERHIAQCRAEEESLKRVLEQKQIESTQVSAEFEQIRSLVSKRLDAESENIAKTKEQMDVLVRYEQTIVEKNNMITAQQKEIEALKLELSVLKESNDFRQVKVEPVYHNGVVEVEEASGSVGTPSIDLFLQRCSCELQDFTNHIKTLTVHLTDIEQQKFDLESRLRHAVSQLELSKSEIKNLSEIETQLKAKNDVLKEIAERAQAEVKKVAKMTEHLSSDVEMGNERIAAFQMVVEAADQRVQVAERRLHEVMHAQAVLKGANIQLQRKLTQLLEQYQILKQERDGLEMDLACGDGSPGSPVAVATESDLHDNNNNSAIAADIYDNSAQADDHGDGETVASAAVQPSSVNEEVTTTVRKVGRPSNKSIASRRRSSRS